MDTSPTPSSSTTGTIDTTGTNDIIHQSKTRIIRNSASSEKSDPRWIIATTASRHFCRAASDFAPGTWRWLRDPIPVDGSPRSLIALSAGTVKFKLPSGRVLEIEALFVPFIQNSLLSAGRLSEEYKYEVVGDVCLLDEEVFAIGDAEFYVTAEILRSADYRPS